MLVFEKKNYILYRFQIYGFVLEFTQGIYIARKAYVLNQARFLTKLSGFEKQESGKIPYVKFARY
jgi:hypothetical protein